MKPYAVLSDTVLSINYLNYDCHIQIHDLNAIEIRDFKLKFWTLISVVIDIFHFCGFMQLLWNYFIISNSHF
jgi:hypothetical protein